MDQRWLSNAFVVGDEPGGVAVFVDSGAPLEPLLETLERERLVPTHILRTHGHPDHVEHEELLMRRFGIPVVDGSGRDGRAPRRGDPDTWALGRRCRLRRQRRALLLGRHAVPRLGRRRAGRDRPGLGDGAAETLDHDVRVLPGHTDETTIGREWEQNPFVRFWRGLEPEDGSACRLGGVDGVVLVRSPDYDGKGKLLVRFADGAERIVGASRVELL